ETRAADERRVRESGRNALYVVVGTTAKDRGAVVIVPILDVVDAELEVVVGRDLPVKVDAQVGVLGGVARVADGGVNQVRNGNARRHGHSREGHRGRVYAAQATEILPAHHAILHFEREAVGDIRGVLQDADLEGILGRHARTVEVVDLLVRVIVVVEVVAELLVLALDARQLQHVVVVDVPVQLAVHLGALESPRLEVALRRRDAEVLHAALVAVVLPFGRDLEEQLVLDQRAADVGVIHRRPVAVLPLARLDPAVAGSIGRGALAGGQGRVAVAVHGTHRRPRIHVIHVVEVALGPIRTPGHHHAGMEVVAAALADLADHAAGRTAVFGAITGGDGLLLGNGEVRQRHAARAADWIGGVETVEVIGVFHDAVAAHGNQRRTGGAIAEGAAAQVHARSQQRNRLGAVSQRQDLQLLRGHHRGLAGGGHVDRRQRVGRDGDAGEVLDVLAGFSGSERHLRTAAHAYRHVVLRGNG